jgi:hypothetical protein
MFLLVNFSTFIETSKFLNCIPNSSNQFCLLMQGSHLDFQNWRKFVEFILKFENSFKNKASHRRNRSNWEDLGIDYRLKIFLWFKNYNHNLHFSLIKTFEKFLSLKQSQLLKYPTLMIKRWRIKATKVYYNGTPQHILQCRQKPHKFSRL